MARYLSTCERAEVEVKDTAHAIHVCEKTLSILPVLHSTFLYHQNSMLIPKTKP